MIPKKMREAIREGGGCIHPSGNVIFASVEAFGRAALSLGGGQQESGTLSTATDVGRASEDEPTKFTAFDEDFDDGAPDGYQGENW